MKIAVIGRSEVLFDTLEKMSNNGHEIKLVVTSKEAPEYTKTSSDFEKKAEELSASFIYTPKISEELSKIQAFDDIDIAISMNYSGIIPQSIIDCFRLGILNAHGGDLPKYRGNACQAWAILNGEEKIGLCIHRMIGGELDSGDIIARDYFDIDLNTKVGVVWEWMNEKIPELFRDAINHLESDENYLIEKQDKNPNKALRCYPRMEQDGRIDWEESAISVIRLINASNKPYSGAFCYIGGNKLTIWDANIQEDNEVFLAIPGQVTKICNGSVEVATKKGKIILNSVEYDNKIVTPDKIIKSIRTRLL